MRVLGAGFVGSGPVLVEGLRWAIEQGYDVINMSLSTTKSKFVGELHELADTAYFRRTIVVASANNMPVASYPWRFSSVISVASHEVDDSGLLPQSRSAGRVLRPRRDVDVAWRAAVRSVDRQQLRHAARLGHLRARLRSTAIDALRAEDVLYLTAANVADDGERRRRAARRRQRGRPWRRGQPPALLRSIVQVARAIFHGQGAALMLLDEEADELVFEAVVGEGSDTLIGQRFPSSTGIGGWVLDTRQPLVIKDVRQDPRFSRTTAEETGYVPEGMMCVPLLHDEQALGVL